MMLRDQRLLTAVGAARPVLVRPAQTERKRQGGILEMSQQGQLEQTLPGKPVEVVAEATQTVLLGQLDLTPLHRLHAQVVEAQLTGQARLMLALDLWQPTRHIGPLREALAPPLITLGRWVELGQIECQRS